jgi:hypothetical protein
MGKFLVITGLILVVVGLLISYADKIPLLGKLPGDIYINKQNYKVFFPITTSIVLSILVSLILFLIQRLKN